uniref:Uncharacterized protein n=1 Tax=Myoviridae sp. ctPuP5 TaxID=2823543 RepID=A0A8S5L9H1_9CAUD|nr:MAG TPA: hypothetical protein [Myoviridae sp. ctPuP5]
MLHKIVYLLICLPCIRFYISILYLLSHLL